MLFLGIKWHIFCTVRECIVKYSNRFFLKHMKTNIVKMLVVSAVLLIAPMMHAQQLLSLDTCRQMAVKYNRTLEQAKTKVKMAEIDRKIALSHYFPKISASGTYIYNSESPALVSNETSAWLQNMGTTVQQQFGTFAQQLMTAIMSNPQAVNEYLNSPMWQTFLGTLQKNDVSQALNALGTEIDDMMHPDMQHVFAGIVSVQQPVFMGGKIVAANRVAKLAEQLSDVQYDIDYQQIIVNVDRAYWQIVSIANKKKLATAYADLLHRMEREVDISAQEGMQTESDVLQIRVKANEADMMQTKATNGLILAKMLLCKQIGIALDSNIMLEDETLENIPLPLRTPTKSLEQIYADRPETKSLDLASQIYKGKVAVARADMMPNIALTANYIVTNPNMENGFQKSWNGMFNAGVVVNVPVFHALEALQKTRKAKLEASLYKMQLEDAKNLINLQVMQLRKQQSEAAEKLIMAENNLSSAEENLRAATIGFEEGVINANTALAAQTAWLHAHSEYIDAGIELQMLAVQLDKAEGNLHAQPIINQ